MKFLTFLVMFTALAANGQLKADSILVEGHYRTFHFVPPAHNNKPGNLLFILHGSGGEAKNMIKSSAALQEKAENEDLLLVFPDGYQHFWNECRRMSNAAANLEDINENAFFEEMIRYFKQRGYSSGKNVFVAGFSGGGQMSYKLGLTMPRSFNAIGAIVANLPDSAYSDCAASGISRPVIIINGTDDPTNPYMGGEMFVNNTSFGVVRSSEGTLKYWAKLAGYKGEPLRKIIPDRDTTDRHRLETYTYKTPGKPEIILYKVVGGKHEYPMGIDAYLIIWEFFKKQKTWRK